MAPPKKWTSSFPYCAQHVLFPLESQWANVGATILVPNFSQEDKQILSEELPANDSLGRSGENTQTVNIAVQQSLSAKNFSSRSETKATRWDFPI